MKKSILLFSIVTCLVFINVGLSYKSNSSAVVDLMLDNIINVANAEATGTSFTCYTTMSYVNGGRVLECNTPCCYKADYNSSGLGGGKCTGSFSDCS